MLARSERRGGGVERARLVESGRSALLHVYTQISTHLLVNLAGAKPTCAIESCTRAHFELASRATRPEGATSPEACWAQRLGPGRGCHVALLGADKATWGAL